MKKVYIILAILFLLIAGAGGTIYYFLNVKTYDLSQDHELKVMTEEEYELVLPPEDESEEGIAIEDKENSSEEAQEHSQDDTNTSNEDETEDNSNPNPNNQRTTKKATAASIKEKYRPSFDSLEAQANAKINSLVNRAITEYREKRANGEEISYSYFLTKYKTAGEALEAKTDQAFEQLYAALQKELRAKGFDPNEAKEVRATYEAMKKQRREALLTKAMESL